MSARDDVYAGIRRSLAVSADDALRRDVARARIEEARGGLRPKRGDGDQAQRIATFSAQAQGVNASISIVDSLADAVREIAAFLREHNLPAQVRIGADDRLTQLNWSGSAIEISEGVSSGDDLSSVSHAEAGVSETGTLVIVSGAHNPSTLNFLPDNHIAILRGADIVPVYEDAFALLRARYGKGEMPRTVNLVTGPSRSADIEQKLLLGAHGPRRLHILIVQSDT